MALFAANNLMSPRLRQAWIKAAKKYTTAPDRHAQLTYWPVLWGGRRNGDGRLVRFSGWLDERRHRDRVGGVTCRRDCLRATRRHIVPPCLLAVVR